MSSCHVLRACRPLVSLRSRIIFNLSVLVVLYSVLNQINSRKSTSAFRTAIDECEKFTRPAGLGDAGKLPPTYLSEMLLEVDHVFVLGVEACYTSFPRTFIGRATCVIGRQLDTCAPTSFTQGAYLHAMKVSFAHATVLYLARKARYKHIAVIEDDIIVRNDVFSESLVHNFHSLLVTNKWSVIRFGYRPYFLEQSSREHCPSKCRCQIRQDISEQFCELSLAGCDLRSSDFYVISARYYDSLRSAILDLRQADSKRIVDTRPMRQLERQWLLLPQASIQTTLDIPVDYQIGLSALYVKKCAYPRPLPAVVTKQLFNFSVKIVKQL